MPSKDVETFRLSTADDAPEAKKYRLIRRQSVYLVLGLVVALSVPIFSFLSEMHEANKALDAFSQDLVAREYDAAYRAASIPFQSALSEQKFVGQQTMLCAEFGKLKAVRREGSRITFDSNGLSTTIVTTFVFENSEHAFLFKLRKADGSWRVFRISQ